MKTSNALFVLISLLLASSVAYGQGTISGLVTEAKTGMALPGVSVSVRGTGQGTVTDIAGHYTISVFSDSSHLEFKYVGYETITEPVKGRWEISVALVPASETLDEIIVTGKQVKRESKALGYALEEAEVEQRMVLQSISGRVPGVRISANSHNTESYEKIEETGFRSAARQPLSTFSADVDAASYSNMRRFINEGNLPPNYAVRVEEMINYFDYDYKQPDGDHPFAVNSEQAVCPWAPDHRLVRVGIQGQEIEEKALPASNLVFLLDVSGSMDSSDKLPLLKSALRMLVGRLRPEDRVAIVVYAGAAGLVLPSTSGAEKNTILEALDKLEAGGSTAGGEGIKLAYDVAVKNFSEEGNNRVILATDGDFNVGASSNAAMQELVEEKRETGVFLTVLGFGTGNYKDDRMEIMADKGNGNYAYIDNILEARKVLVSEMGGTLVTIAKDVKFQVEFNPAYVAGYRLIGYENRRLNDEDFNDDKKDAGDIGAGHNVTALYEIIPAGTATNLLPDIDGLKYQETKSTGQRNGELMNIKLRYKKPDSNKSVLVEVPFEHDAAKNFNKASNDFRWAAAVAEAGLLLSQSEYAGNASFSHLISTARVARGSDAMGYRAEFIRLMEIASEMHDSGLEARK
ncbi:MAG: von Willebrand factor type A domain-containing protein [Cyclobacteriaceae bacterium]